MSPTYWFQKIYIQMFFWEKIINLGVPKRSNLHWKNVKNSWRVPIWIPNGPNGFYCYYKLGKLFLLQIWATLITNWSRVVTNWDRFVINRSSYYKSEEILQIVAQQTSSSIERIHKNMYKMMFLFIATIDHEHMIEEDWQLINFLNNIRDSAIILVLSGEMRK